MSSINLLPKKVKFEEELIKSKKSNVAFAVSFLMILFTVLFFAGLYVSNRYISKEISVLNSQVEAADEKINEEISDNKFLIAEVKAKKNNLLLAKHTCPTKVLDLIRNSLVAETYLNSLSVTVAEKGFVIFKLNGTAKNYQSIVSQTRVFENLPSIESVNVENVSVDDSGYEEFEVVLKFKEEILFYEN